MYPPYSTGWDMLLGATLKLMLRRIYAVRDGSLENDCNFRCADLPRKNNVV